MKARRISMRKYETPEMKVAMFEKEDITTMSGRALDKAYEVTGNGADTTTGDN